MPDALLPHPARDILGFDAVHAHAATAVLEGHHGRQHHQVQYRQRQHDALRAVRPEAAFVHLDRAGQQDIVVAVHRALGPSGGAAGVGDGRRLKRVHRHRRTLLQSRPRATVSCQALADEAGFDTDDLLQRRQVLSLRRDFLAALRVGQVQAGTAVLQDEGFFRRRERSVDTDPDRAEARAGEQRDNDIHIVGQAGRDAIVLAYALRVQNGGRPGDLLIQLAVAVARAATDQREPVRDRGATGGPVPRRWSAGRRPADPA